MPRIAEIRKINEQVWVRLSEEGNLDMLEAGGVTMWTPQEVEAHRHQAMQDAATFIIKHLDRIEHFEPKRWGR